MRTGLVTMALAAVALLAVAVFVVIRRNADAPPGTPGFSPAGAQATPASKTRERAPQPGASRGEAKAEPLPIPGSRLGDGSKADALSNAQAIIDETLAELRRLDGAHREHARDVYMRGHAAAERVEDELDEDDEPGRAALRADEDTMKAELRRIYGAPEVAGAPAAGP